MRFLKRKNLTEREMLFHAPVLHWMYVAKHLIVFFILFLGFIIAQLSLNFFNRDIYLYIVFALIIIFIFKAVWHILRYQSVEYGITNKRLIVKYGILRITTMEIAIDKIESISCRQNLFGMIFNYGNLIINGIGGKNLVFYMVCKPYAVRRKVIEIMEKNRIITVIHGDIPKPVKPVKPDRKKTEDIYLWGTFIKMPSS